VKEFGDQAIGPIEPIDGQGVNAPVNATLNHRDGIFDQRNLTQVR
jgi:hypothetical protein